MVDDLEFDPSKQQKNLGKHGIDFELASTVLDDPYSLTLDDYSDHNEERYFTVGIAINGQILVVNWTLRGDNLRLISARDASPQQKRDYYARR